MNKDEDYASESDESDEDFRPDKESDDDSETGDDLNENDEVVLNVKSAKGKGTKNVKKLKTKKAVKRKHHDNNDDDDDDDDDENNDYDDNDDDNEAEITLNGKRNTRQRDSNGGEKRLIEKDTLESDEEDKSHTDALWADFLSDVKQPAKVTTVTTATTATTEKASTTETATTATNSTRNVIETKKNHVNGNSKTETMEATSPKIPTKVAKLDVQNNTNDDKTKLESVSTPCKKLTSQSLVEKLTNRKSVGGVSGVGGVSSLLNQIGKKKKVSVLEKSHLDWKSFKHDEGIEEELQTHNKGKDGFLERQDFLQRTDLRQFEIEKNLRKTRRN